MSRIPTCHSRIVGNNHLKMDLQLAENPKETFSAIAFSQAQHFDDVLRKKLLVLVLQILNSSFWMNFRIVNADASALCN